MGENPHADGETRGRHPNRQPARGRVRETRSLVEERTGGTTEELTPGGVADTVGPPAALAVELHGEGGPENPARPPATRAQGAIGEAQRPPLRGRSGEKPQGALESAGLDPAKGGADR